jgi:hypothetical protein
MKKILSIISIAFCFVVNAHAQTATTFVVQGDLDKFYPITFTDPNWANDKATVIEIGRSEINADATVRGSMISKFTYHTNRWGNGSNFITADLYESTNFVAGWKDATANNSNALIIIWLKGGTTTYKLTSVATVALTVYDGVANTLPYAETNGPSHGYKTALDENVLANGTTVHNFLASSHAMVMGNIGIGTTSPTAAIHVLKPGSSSIKLATSNDPVNYTTDIFSNYDSGNAFQITHAGANILRSTSVGYEKIELGNSANQNVNILTDKLTINGNVGIGTTTPSAKLHVNGVLKWGGMDNYTYGGEDNGGAYLEHIGNSSATSIFRLQTAKAGTTQYSVFRSNPYAGFSFTTYNGGNANLGLGTLSPLAPLHVNGGLPMTAGWNQTSILEAAFSSTGL